MYQASFEMPNLCGGGLVRLRSGGTSAPVSMSTDTTDKVHVRWHYRPGSTGGA